MIKIYQNRDNLSMVMYFNTVRIVSTTEWCGMKWRIRRKKGYKHAILCDHGVSLFLILN